MTSANRRCRKCGQPIRLRSVGKDHDAKVVRKWCLADDAGSPAGGPTPPIDCPRGGYHQPFAQLTAGAR